VAGIKETSQVSIGRISAEDALSKLGSFSDVIDARSEGEYAEDHLPGAVNWPSLHDDERKIVGTQYKQINAFEAKKLGAALVAKNIAAHIQRDVLDKPREWQPLVYCWRGGKRSGSLALILDQIGFRVTLVDGGYKAFRAALVADLPQLAARHRYQVVCGTTGQDPAAAGAGGRGRADAGPGGAGPSSQLGAGHDSGCAAAQPESL
jgi:tRNA 2-selenouridine synthase